MRHGYDLVLDWTVAAFARDREHRRAGERRKFMNKNSKIYFRSPSPIVGWRKVLSNSHDTVSNKEIPFHHGVKPIPPMQPSCWQEVEQASHGAEKVPHTTKAQAKTPTPRRRINSLQDRGVGLLACSLLFHHRVKPVPPLINNPGCIAGTAFFSILLSLVPRFPAEFA
jgi:hypothetical protein